MEAIDKAVEEKASMRPGPKAGSNLDAPAGAHAGRRFNEARPEGRE